MKYSVIIAVAVLALLAPLSENHKAPTTKLALKNTSAKVISVPTPMSSPKPANVTPMETKTVAIVDTPTSEPVGAPKSNSVPPGSCADYANLIDQYDWNTEIATAICQAESGGVPTAISAPDIDGLRDYGLFQIHGEEILDPTANVARAYQKYLDQGWDAWSTFKSGKYLRFL